MSAGNDDIGRETRDFAAAARDCDIGAGNKHPRTFDDSTIDGIAQRYVDESAIAAHISNGGESSSQRSAGILDALQSVIGG